MTRRIRLLPDEVANQIAAGEVVERPASVVKELVENALDARATRIEILIERGGKRRIRVADDGIGMGREDAILSLDRHATSKISRAKDLEGVRSFGFRGEALPSIAAVSWLTLETCEAGDDPGTRVRVKGGRMIGVDDCARQRGTTVEVEKLFSNAPARAKFLKSVSAESRAVSDVVTVLALANPTVGLTLESDGRTLLDLPPCKHLVDRIESIWGRAAAATLIPIDGEMDGMRVNGLIQRPDAAQPGARRTYLLVNGRPFRDRKLVEAARRGYRTTIPPAARPWLFLYLDVPAGSVDVNVHPAKAEVRFRDRFAVDTSLEEAIRAVLSTASSAASFDGIPGARDATGEAGRVEEHLDNQDRHRDAGELAVPSAGEPSQYSDRDGGSVAVRDRGAQHQTSLFVSGTPPADVDAAGSIRPDVTVEDRPRLWQLHQTYILAETRDGLLIIDQHSAHERVLFERLMTAFEGAGQTSQRLLFPITLRVTPAELDQVESVGGLLRKAGFEVEPFGGDTVIVHAVPNPHPWFDAERCLREMIAELTEGSELVRSARNQHERIAMTFACKGAIKAGERMSASEMQELFDALFATSLPHHDVHGRPTIIRLGGSELEKRFGRH